MTTAGAPLGDEESEHYEIVDGERVRLPPMSAFASWLASEIAFAVHSFAKANGLGEATTETLFRLPLPRERSRRPDAAFVSYRRWAKGKPLSLHDDAWDVVPDLAVEVVSPTDFAEDLLEKIDEYFRAGVTLVWVVSPLRRLVYAYESPTLIRVLTTADELDGGAVLPGFRLAVAELFPGPTDPAPDNGAA